MKPILQSLEGQLTGRDQASVVNNTVMRNLEVQQATSVSDLRSRVARYGLHRTFNTRPLFVVKT